jgi:two-component system, LytTR family, sensor kinase
VPLWSISFGVWGLVSLAATATVYEMYHLVNAGMKVQQIAGMEFSSIFTYAPLTPFAFAFAMRYPIQRTNWLRRTWWHLLAGFVFTLGHVLLKSLTPQGYYDAQAHEWTSAIWNSHLHAFRDPWVVLKSMLLVNIVDDISGAYLPTILVAHVLCYYRRLTQRELHATQLEQQLAQARLQTLQSQLQPHFLFNTLHSISSLMLIDVVAADRMMSSLSDLLRMSLEQNGTQMTSLNREVEFLGVYLEIEKTRFEDRLEVVFDISPDCLDAQVPHLLLQPIVENAVRHGVSRRSSQGEIRIVAKHQGGDLHLWIRDNGPGFVDAGGDGTKHGLGLRLTRERLHVLFGTQQRCDVASTPHMGTEVHLQMPYSLSAASTIPTITRIAAVSEWEGAGR